MAQTFEEYVDEWAALDRQAKKLTADAMAMRKAIATSVAAAQEGGVLKEGANTVTMADGRKITVTHKINRSLSPDEFGPARASFNAINDRPCDFDDLLKVKYDLVVSQYRKLEGPALAVFSDVMTAKDGAPEVVIK